MYENETYFYFKKLSHTQGLKRYKIETITHNQLLLKGHLPKHRIFFSFVKKILYNNNITYLKNIYYAYLSFKTNIEINQELKKTEQ